MLRGNDLGHRSLAALAVALLALVAGTAHAASAPLDARARASFAALRAGAPSVAALRARGMGVSATGELDVVIHGTVAAGALARAGVRVRTSLPGMCTAFVPASALERVASLPGVESI